MIALSRTKTDRVIRCICLCGATIDVHGQVDREYVEALPAEGKRWVCAMHEVTARTRTVVG